MINTAVFLLILALLVCVRIVQVQCVRKFQSWWPTYLYSRQPVIDMYNDMQREINMLWRTIDFDRTVEWKGDQSYYPFNDMERKPKYKNIHVTVNTRYGVEHKIQRWLYDNWVKWQRYAEGDDSLYPVIRKENNKERLLWVKEPQKNDRLLQEDKDGKWLYEWRTAEPSGTS